MRLTSAWSLALYLTFLLFDSCNAQIDCKDVFSNCREMARDGACESDINHEILAENCRRSCGWCSNCFDVSDACPWNVTEGRCEADPDYSFLHCRRSCGWCLSNVVVVFNDSPLDSTTFMSYVDFAVGLSLNHLGGNFSLLSYNSRKGKFSVHFGPTEGTMVTHDMWLSRPNVSMTTEGEANHMFRVSEIVIYLDIDIPRNVSACKNYDHLLYEQSNETYDSLPTLVVQKKCYYIFTQQGHRFTKEKGIHTDLTENRYSRLPGARLSDTLTGVSVSQRNYFRNASQFYFKFEKIYQEIFQSENSYTLGENLCSPYFKKDVCYKGFNTLGNFMIYYFHELDNVNKKWIVANSTYRRDWYEANAFCSTLGLSLPDSNSQHQINVLNTLMSHAVGGGNLQFPLKIIRSSRTPGERFVLSNNKDLMFASWRNGQPRGARWKRCAGYLYDRSDETHGWFTVGCAHKAFNLVICTSDDLQTLKDLNDVSESKLDWKNVVAEKGLEIVHNKENNLSVEASATFQLSAWIATGGEDISEKSWKNNITEERNETNQISYREIQPLFHICEAEGDVSSRVAIPLVYICDGKADCLSGSDESLCGYFGIASCSPHEWTCQSRECVSIRARCDLIKDCKDGSDEIGCGFICQHRMCGNGRCLPSPWFNDGQEDCDDGEDEDGEFAPDETCVFLCNRTQCVTRAMLNDSFVDCKGPEGPLDESLGALESVNCTTQRGEPLINNWAPRCVLVRDMFGEIIGCRYFQHLQRCENFTCPPGYVKCPNSFCIPLSYVADGKYDCYGGDDELSPISNVGSIFKCQLSGKQVVAPSAVCDGRKDCRFGEDEVDCGISCSSGLVCVAGAVSAVKYNRSLPLLDLSFIDRRIRYLDLSSVEVSNFFNTFPPDHLAHLLTLKLYNCSIGSVATIPEAALYEKTSVCTPTSRDFQTVQTLDLSYNKIKSLPSCSYLRLMSGLRDLKISHNYQLTEISPDSFHGYFELITLDLSFTAIKNIDRNQFRDLFSLQTLYLQHSSLNVIDFIVPANVENFNVEGMDIKHVGRDTLRNVISIKEIRSPTYKLCCSQVLGQKTMKHTCHYSPGEDVSCHDLVEEFILRSLLWLVSLSILSGNTATLVYRLVWERQFLNKPFVLYVTNLGVADLLMGVYLMAIGIADSSSRGEYVFHDFFWRNSSTCWAAGTIVTLSSITSSLFLALITLERYLAVRYPYGEVRLSQKATTKAVVAVWIFGICVASLPLLPFAETWVIYSNTGLCIGLPLANKNIPGWHFSASLFIGFNLTLFTIIGLGQAAIFKTIREKGKRIKETSNKNSQLRANARMQEFAIAKQLSIVVLSDFMCLFPVILLGLMSMFSYEVEPSSYRWTAVIIVPINAALNPLLYTLPAIKAKLSNYVIGRQKARNTARVEAFRLQVMRKYDLRVSGLDRIKLSVNIYKRMVKMRSRVRVGNINRKDLVNLGSRVRAVINICKKLLG